MGMDHHPIHMHGHQWVTTGTEGGRVPQAAWTPGNTVLVGVAQARTVEFVAERVGEWMLHCHLPHHMMNQMVSMVGPMTHGGHGMSTGGDMAAGMGMIMRGGALGADLGPSLGRGLGYAADRDRATSGYVSQPGLAGDAGAAPPQAGHDHAAMLAEQAAAQQQAAAQPAGPGHDHAAMLAEQAAAEGKRTPGYPQDMWMPMDHLVDHKPENYGLRKEWTASMMGMMTLVRVLEPAMFDKIAELQREQQERQA